jgi:hypothetical protein
MKRWVILAPLALLVACSGGSPVQSVAPTPETIAFLRIDPAALRSCVDVESLVVDGMAGLFTGSENAALESAVRTGLQRCGETARLIDVAGRPPEERPRAEACQRAFAAKAAAYAAINQALAADGDFMAVQEGTRESDSRRPRCAPATHRPEQAVRQRAQTYILTPSRMTSDDGSEQRNRSVDLVMPRPERGPAYRVAQVWTDRAFKCI